MPRLLRLCLLQLCHASAWLSRLRLGLDDPAWVPTVFTKNRDRLLNTDIARKFLAAILAHRDVAPLLSDEHFSVDGTLIEPGHP